MLHLLMAATLTAGLDPKEPTKKADTPRGVSPVVASAHFERGEIILRRTIVLQEMVPVTRVVMDGDKTVAVTTYEIALKYVTTESKHTYRTLQGYNRDGELLDEKTLCKRLSKETPVLLAQDSKAIDAFYLKLLPEDGVVIVLPPKKDEPKPEPVKPAEKNP
jgi:hypothetical protein